MLNHKITIPTLLSIIFISFPSYSMDKSDINNIMDKCESWASNSKNAIKQYPNNYQQHITACQKHDILTSLSKKYGNATLIPNVVYGNFITIFDNQMHHSWMYDNKKMSKSEYVVHLRKFKYNLTNIIKIMESS